jgi:hypothetical protein
VSVSAPDRGDFTREEIDAALYRIDEEAETRLTDAR